MGVGKAKKKSTKIIAVPEGLQIQNDERFYKDIRTALTAALGAGFLAQTTKQIGQRKLVYIRQPSSPTVQGREGPLPVLPLFIDDRQSAWLVVELESEYGEPLMLKHVSLKLWQGPTTDAAHLCFRAEWDVRNAESSHAQPLSISRGSIPHGSASPLLQSLRSRNRKPSCTRDNRIRSGP